MGPHHRAGGKGLHNRLAFRKAQILLDSKGGIWYNIFKFCRAGKNGDGGGSLVNKKLGRLVDPTMGLYFVVLLVFAAASFC